MTEALTISACVVEELVAAIQRRRDGREAAITTVADWIEIELEVQGVIPARTTAGRPA